MTMNVCTYMQHYTHYVHVCACVCMCVHVCACVCMCMCVCVCVCVCFLLFLSPAPCGILWLSGDIFVAVTNKGNGTGHKNFSPSNCPVKEILLAVVLRMDARSLVSRMSPKTGLSQCFISWVRYTGFPFKLESLSSLKSLASQNFLSSMRLRRTSMRVG